MDKRTIHCYDVPDPGSGIDMDTFTHVHVMSHLSTGLVACFCGGDSLRADGAGGVQGGDGDSVLC